MGKRRSPKHSTLVLTTALLLLYRSHCSMIHANMTDRRSLLDFKEAITDDPTGVLRTWNDIIHHCMWSGVRCSTRHPQRVTALILDNLNLTGQITPSLGNLTFLKDLWLYSNRFSGQLPPLNHLTKLETLYLANNLLHGNIPDALTSLTNCSKLKDLDLSATLLVGQIPRNIDSLSNLVYLDLSSNNLSGVIPPTFSNITHLECIYLDENQLKGSIPEDLGKLPNMWEVSLSGNRLSGRVPATLFNLSYLDSLALSTNMLSGTLPSDVADMLPSLEFLSLGNNKLEGHITDSLGNASELKALELSSNCFTGQIPSFLGKLHKLQFLILDKNNLEARDSQSWEFLSALSNCPDLLTLSIYGNQLHGVLPHSVGNLSTNLQVIDFGANYLSGTIPPSIAALKNLQKLKLAGNNFVGPIP